MARLRISTSTGVQLDETMHCSWAAWGVAWHTINNTMLQQMVIEGFKIPSLKDGIISLLNRDWNGYGIETIPTDEDLITIEVIEEVGDCTKQHDPGVIPDDASELLPA